MSQRIALSLVLITLFIGPVVAADRLGDPSLVGRPTNVIPKIFTDFLAKVALLSDDSNRLTLLSAISRWVASNCDLPPTTELPNLVQVSPSRISSIRYGEFPSPGKQQSGSSPHEKDHSTVAIYIERERTIYLPDTFKGDTIAELSVLVHEVVHHMQSIAGLRYDCPQAREKQAYLAQQKWLNQFDRDLWTEFKIDAFTVLVYGSCI